MHWKNFVLNLFNDFKFWLFGIFYFQMFRLATYLFFYKEIQSGSEIFLAQFTGFSFDTMVTCYFVLPSFLMNCIYNKNLSIIHRVRSTFAITFIVLIALVSFATLAFYAEYKDGFNHFIFLGLYDDLYAVFQTAIEDYYLIEGFIVYNCVVYLSIRLYKKIAHISFPAFLYPIKENKGFVFRICITLSILVSLFLGLRGSLKSRPAIRKWAYTTTDEFLNAHIMNPVIRLKYAIKDFKLLNRESYNSFLENTSLEDAFRQSFQDTLYAEPETYFQKRTNAYTIKESPQHVFLLIMEGFDSWPLKDEYQSLHVVDSIRSIAKRGIHFKNFLPSAYSTMNSVASILTGFPYTGMDTSRRNMSHIKKMSLPEQAKRLGYHVRLFFGGFSSWQNITEFSKAVGVDKVYSAAHIGYKQSEKGIWGVDDEDLFKFVLSKLKSEEKTLNIILTTSYHAPFNMNVRAKGFTMKKVPKELRSIYDGNLSINRLGHLWYADQSAGKFISSVERNYDNSLFFITGDHYGRRFLNRSPNLYEKSSVPFLIYGKNVNGEQRVNPGSHIDILPTLLNSITSEEISYDSFGTDLLSETPQEYAFMVEKIITKRALYYFDAGKQDSLILNPNETNIPLSQLKQHLQNKLGISKHFILNGNTFNSRSETDEKL